MSILWLLFVFQILSSVQSFFRSKHLYKIKLSESSCDGDPGTPLFLTTYIESGNITEGRRLARVPFTEKLRIKSYAGFFTVNKKYDSNQFFWYFPAMGRNKKDAPVILWLQGGPGSTSLYGLFSENGPLTVRNQQFERRKYTWALNHHVIYIDNPVGTGFSFTKDTKGYCTNETQVGEDLYSSLVQFFQLFPKLQQNKFFITGESYAGKYVPSLAYTIHKRNPKAAIKINLKAIAIGDGWCDPEHQLVYSKYLYQIGLIDWNQAEIVANYESKAIDFIKKKQWNEANYVTDTILGPLFSNMTGYSHVYNFLHTNDYGNDFDFVPMLQKCFVRKGIHVGTLPFSDDSNVYDYLTEDINQSVAPLLTELLNHYNVLMYSGQLDIIVAYPLTLNFLRNLNFTRSYEYATAKRYQWIVDDEIAGYVKQAGRLTEIMVRNAGHMVPKDQPKWALDMITRLTHEKPFHDNK